MAMSKYENNEVWLVGEIEGEFIYNHSSYGEDFYTTRLTVSRTSGAIDYIPLMVSDRIIDVNDEWAGALVAVEGTFRSYNKHFIDGGSRLMLHVFCDKIRAVSREDGYSDANYIRLNGFICKPPVYRETPMEREIADILVAVNRPYKNADYIPCICWGRNARYASRLEVGQAISLKGRIQSRMYSKKLDDGEIEIRMAYEMSASKLETGVQHED